MSDTDRLGIGLRHDDEHPRRRRRGRRPGRHGRFGRLVLFVLVVLVVLAVPAAAFVGIRSLVSGIGSGPADYSGSGTGSVLVHVKPGDSLTQVGRTLAADGVVRSSEAFTSAASGNSRATGLQPGYYRLRHRMSGAAALGLLLDPASRVSTRVTVPEGATAAQVLALYEKETKLDPAGLRAAVRAPKGVPLPAYAGGRSEGFLFPATYDVDPGTTPDGAISAMVAQFDKEASALDLVAGARRLGVTPYQLVTVASITEKEAGVASDFPKVARVVYNRLHAGMKLQLDSTLNYVLARRKGHLSDADIRNPSAYNTYVHPGLPPTPIDNPGARALQAALHPAPGNWIYFVTIDKAGHSAFTADYQQFLRDKEEATRNGVIK